MSTILHYLPYVLLFMLATMLIYGWGLWKTARQGADLSRQLYAKARSRVKKALKREKVLDRKRLLQVIDGLTASQPFSAKRMGITDPELFLDTLLEYMLTQKDILREKNSGKICYRLADRK